jgi:hypothetical protein
MKSKLISLAFLATVVAGAFAPRAVATVSLGNDQTQIGGFFSQGWLYGSNNNFPTANKGGTWDFREMAFNASTTFGSHLRVGGQAFAQRFGALGDDKVILDWAVADYNFNPAIGVRVGRVKYPKGLYGEALDLDVVRPFVFLPSAVYSPVMRDFTASFDGAMVYGSVNAFGSFDYKAFVGDIPMSKQKGVAEFYNNAGLYNAAAGGVSSLGMDSVAGGQLAWNTPVSGLKAIYSYSRFANLHTDGPFTAVPTANLRSNIERFTWHTFSAEYAVKNWLFATEFQRANGMFGYKALPYANSAPSPVGWDGWYVSAARRLNNRFELGAYYGRLWNRYATVRSAPGSHQIDHTLSLRYDASERVIFKLEGHRIDGTYQTFNTTRLPNPTATRKNYTTVFAAKTTLSF